MFKEELGTLSKHGMKSWEELKTNIHKVSDNIIGKNVLEPRKKWMTQEILDKVSERNYWRKRNVDKYINN